MPVTFKKGLLYISIIDGTLVRATNNNSSGQIVKSDCNYKKAGYTSNRWRAESFNLVEESINIKFKLMR